MKLITTAMRIANIAERWTHQYFRDGVWRETKGEGTPLSSERTKNIAEKLRALPPGASAADVNAVIGNDSWVKLECSECRIRSEAVVLLGDSYLCRACLGKALELVG